MFPASHQAQLRTGLNDQAGTGLEVNPLPSFEHQALANASQAIALYLQATVMTHPLFQVTLGVQVDEFFAASIFNVQLVSPSAIR